MLCRLHLVQAGIAAGLACLPGLSFAQTQERYHIPLAPLFAPVQLDEQQVQQWARDVVNRIDGIWTETKREERETKLVRLAENTPAELAFITRVLKRNETKLHLAGLTAVRDVFTVLRRTDWKPEDRVHVQRVIAGWSVMVPELLRIVGHEGASPEVRRLAEAILSDLAKLGRDARLGSVPARQAWQPQLRALTELSRHAKPTVREASLHIIEALGPDARSLMQDVAQALGDQDRFVRWSAVQTLSALGTDPSSLQALATLQQDPDPDVRAAAITAVQNQPGGRELLVLEKDAPPLPTPALIQSAVAEVKKAPETPPVRDKLPPPQVVRPVEVAKEMPKAVAPKIELPKAEVNKTEVSKAPETPPNPTPRVVKPNSVVKPKVSETETKQAPPLRHVFTSSTPTAEPVALTESKVEKSIVPPRQPDSQPVAAKEAKAEKSVAPPPRPDPLPRPVSASPPPVIQVASGSVANVNPAQAAAPVVKPAMTTAPVVKPAVTAIPVVKPTVAAAPVVKPAEVTTSVEKSPPSQVRPLFEPPPASRLVVSSQAPTAPVTLTPPPPTKAPAVRTVEADAVRIDVTEMWVKQLKKGTSVDQVRALRELAKFKGAAGQHVPQIAELLLKGDVAVRREVPLTLQAIGPAARIAAALLERGLNDEDTEVKVNAARCLVELSIK